MLNGVVTRINSFIETLNAALGPVAGMGDRRRRRGGSATLDAVDLSRIDNPFRGRGDSSGNGSGRCVFRRR